MAKDPTDAGVGPVAGAQKPPVAPATKSDGMFLGLRDSTLSYGAALAISSPVMPLAAAIITVGAYYQNPHPTVPTLFGGTLVAGVLWLIGAFICRGLTSARGGNAERYDDLRGRLARLDVWLGLDPGTSPENAKAADIASRAGYVNNPDALKQALACRNEAYSEMGRSDLRWVARTGYQSMWKQIHMAESMLLEVLPVSEVAGNVRADYLRLQGSQIGNRKALLDTLVTAVRALGPEAAAYFPAPSAPSCSDAPSAPTPADPAHARSMLCQVRVSINQYRDYHWDGLVRSRNQLIVTVFVSGLVTYLLVELAVIGMVSRLALLTAAVLYFVGTIFGLLKRLYDESQVSRAVDDYGLSMTRIITTPIFSGLAAIAGVMLYVVILSFTAGSGASTAASASSTLVPSQIFDLSKYPIDLVIAAIFGLAPNALVNYVQQQSKQYVGDIKSSQTADTSATTGGGKN